jgi:hypothetical protein
MPETGKLTMPQPSLFPGAPTAKQLLAERRFGREDARCGLPRANLYSRQLAGLRLEHYNGGYDEGLALRG